MNNYREVLITPESTIRDALEVINSSGLQVALVVNASAHLLGLLTDGDLRRAMLDGASMADLVGPLMKPGYRYVENHIQRSQVKKIMLKESLRHLPVVDGDKRIIGLYTWRDLFEVNHYSNSVVIMAGGKGIRLRPHTETCPKPMLLVDGRPMLEIVLEQCIAAGFTKFYISINYLKEQIIGYFQNGARWGVSIDYLVEDEPLGTAGSLRLLPESIDEPFLVLNGDVLTRLNPSHLLDFHCQHDAQATLCVREYEFTMPFGVVQTNGTELAGFEEKPTYRHLVNAGVYVIDPQLLPLLPPHQATDMPSLLQTAQQAGHRVAVCPIHEYWIDVGRPETLEEAHTTWGNLR